MKLREAKVMWPKTKFPNPRMQKQPEKKKKGGYVAGNKKKNRHYIIPEHDAILRTLVSALIDFYKVQNHNVST